MKIKSLTDIDAVRAYLTRVGAEVRSFKTAVVKENFGKYWKDIAVIKLARDGTISCTSMEHSPTLAESEAIKAQCEHIIWPELKLLKNIVKPPPAVRNAKEKDIFEFRNLNGEIVMLQVRAEVEGEKTYKPYTYWDDDEWRCMEPDGDLPLFNAHRLKDASIVFIHEGAKAARAVQEMVDGLTANERAKLADHPWGRELANAVHIGWIGGALSPLRTNWQVLREQGIKRAYIVADNDEPGRQAVPRISEQLRCLTFSVQFTDEFPPSFDLADPFPEKMFGTIDGSRTYNGPSFRDCLHPATWATDLMPVEGRKAPQPVLRDSFRTMWAYVDESDLFVCREMPQIVRNEEILNKMLAPFSHSKSTASLIVKTYIGRSARICYRPDEEGLTVTFKGSSAINLHVPSNIRAKPGDPKMWEEYLAYMFPHERERHEVKRWCATLIARPDLRMYYGLLLVSESQGIGKTTLGSVILAPLVGEQNVGFPSEADILSNFNDWLAMKRLAIISEIYSGANWKAYHALKSVITDKDIHVNRKYERQYTIDNWCHIIACSNSMRALKMENDDRRWFYPELNERPWPPAKFKALRQWVESGGLSIIKHWAENFGDYVSSAERAPMTERKRELIDGSRSEAQREAAALAEAAININRPIALAMKDIVNWCRAASQSKVFDSDYELRRSMTDAGMIAYKTRIRVGSRMEYVILNPTLNNVINGDEKEAREIIRNAITRCNDIMETNL